MFKEIVVVVFALAAYHADAAAPTKGVDCGRMPGNIYSCLGNPQLLSENVVAKCRNKIKCENMKCIFTESGWMNGDKIDKKKVSDHFATFASAHPEWTSALSHVQTSCLGDRELPAQDIYGNCPEADILYCASVNIIKNASPSQWSSKAECAKTREYASGCPICPDECFTGEFPDSACHDCAHLNWRG